MGPKYRVVLIFLLVRILCSHWSRAYYTNTNFISFFHLTNESSRFHTINSYKNNFSYNQILYMDIWCVLKKVTSGWPIKRRKGTKIWGTFKLLLTNFLSDMGMTKNRHKSTKIWGTITHHNGSTPRNLTSFITQFDWLKSAWSPSSILHIHNFNS